MTLHANEGAKTCFQITTYFAITSTTKKKFNNPVTRMKGKWALKENVTNCIDPNLCYDAPPGANLL
jgi:hypothetical protein